MTAPGRATAHVSWEQALTWRMQRQWLLQRAPADDLVAVVDRMCGLHAQVMSSVELALWARTEGLTREAVQDALWRQRTLVKLWAMRGTLHVLVAADLGRWLTGFGLYKDGWPLYGLRDPAMLELADLVGRALRGRQLTRAELAVEVGRLAGSAAQGELLRGSWGGYLKPASFLGQLCFGPSEGQRVRFTHPDTWLHARNEPTDEEDALTTIARRYLGAHGPATAAELGAWWGVNRAQASRMLFALGTAATEISVDGEPYWVLADHVSELASTPPISALTGEVVRLLPGFDQWVVCASRRDGSGSRPGPGAPALHPAHRTRVYRLQGWVSPVLLVDGRIEGVWRHQRHGRRLHVEIDLFEEQPRRIRQSAEAEAERLASYLGGELWLTWTA